MLKWFSKELLSFSESWWEHSHYGTLFPKEFYSHERNSYEYFITIDKSVSLKQWKFDEEKPKNILSMIEESKNYSKPST